jgi:hypothetical protein
MGKAEDIGDGGLRSLARIDPTPKVGESGSAGSFCGQV